MQTQTIGSALRTPTPANDDMSPSREADLWHQIIVGLTALHEPIGVIAWQARLAGYGPVQFLTESIERIERGMGDAR